MTRIYNIEQTVEWDTVVHTFRDYDVYYQSGYVKAFQIHGDGEPQLFYYESPTATNGEFRSMLVYMRRNTAIEGIYDAITPYGYGGFLFEGDTSEDNLRELWDAYVKKMEEENIVDIFMRFHPLLGNAACLMSFSEVVDLGETIVMDLSSPQVILANITSKNRSTIRKTARNGVVVKHGKSMDLMDKFIKMYNSTMDRVKAKDYYYFKRPFYMSICEDLKDNYEIFWAELEGKIIAMSIIIFANDRMSYHLSCSEIGFQHLSPSNLILYEAAMWGCEKGMKTFHLGGGVGCCNDKLFNFKKKFNKSSNCQFSILKHIFNEEKYERLVEARAKTYAEFDIDNKFFPLYRAE